MQNVTSMFKNIRWLSVRSPLQAVTTVQTAKTNHHHHLQQPRLATFKKLSNGRNIFCVLKRQNTSQRLLPPDSSILPELIWMRFYTSSSSDYTYFRFQIYCRNKNEMKMHNYLGICSYIKRKHIVSSFFNLAHGLNWDQDFWGSYTLWCFYFYCIWCGAMKKHFRNNFRENLSPKEKVSFYLYIKEK